MMMNNTRSSLFLRSASFFFMLLALPCWVTSQDAVQEFKPSGKVWGYAFGDYYLKAGADTATWSSRAEYSGVEKDIHAFSFRRIYLGYDYAISRTFTTQALLESADGIQTSRGDRTVFIKSLHLKWKNIFKGSDLLIGQMSTPTFSLITDKVWGYRSAEKSIADLRGLRSSSDMGIALHGKFDEAGTYGYHLMLGNGSGTRPENLTQSGKTKVIYGEVYGYFFDKQLLLNLYMDYEGGINDNPVVSMKSLVAYQSDPFTIGVEFLSQQRKNAKSDLTNVAPFGYSVWARGTIKEDKIFAFARYDSYDPDNKYRPEDALTQYNAGQMSRHYDEKFFMAGLDFTPHEKVHFMPNIWINSYSPKADNNVLVSRKADVVPRLTFFFEFR